MIQWLYGIGFVIVIFFAIKYMNKVKEEDKPEKDEEELEKEDEK